jgi:hypothetical protein
MKGRGMMLARTLVLVLAGTIACLEPAWGYDQKSGVLWLRKCTSPEANGQIECAIYVRALVEYDELRARAWGEKRAFCVAKGATLGETHRVVVDYLRDHREDLEQPFALLAHRALSERYPCAGTAPPEKK